MFCRKVIAVTEQKIEIVSGCDNQCVIKWDAKVRMCCVFSVHLILQRDEIRLAVSLNLN